MDAVRDLGMKLTVDKNGNDATERRASTRPTSSSGASTCSTPTTARLAEASLFGASSFVAADGKTAQIRDPVRAGEKWFNDGVWKDHFIPNANQINSDLLAKGSEFASGNLAMNEIHTWFTCCVDPAAPAKPIVTDFGWAVAPAYNGATTAKLHADTFSILKTTKHPDEAFTALTALVGSPELLADLRRHAGGPRPAAAVHRQRSTQQFPGIKLDWSVPQAMLAHPDIPNHQAWVPDYAKSKAAWQAFGSGTAPAGVRHRRRAGHVEDDPPGHLRRRAGQEPLAPPPPPSRAGVPPAREAARPVPSPTLTIGATAPP